MSTAGAIVMPKLGLTMTEGVLASWRVRPGDTVAPGDVLFVVETEKIATEIEAQAAGRIESIAVPEGETVPVGAVVATWTGPTTGADFATAAPEPTAAPAPTPAPLRAGEPARPAPNGRIVATPLARRLARERGLDLAGFVGSGPRGRIKAIDIERAAARGAAAPPAPKPATPAARRPATAIETVIARRLTASKQTIPHFYVLAEADVTALVALRADLNADRPAAKISLNDVVVAAVGRALARMPEMNALWADAEIVTLPGSDVGIAVESPRGLLVPVLRQAGTKTLDQAAAAASELVRRARDGALQAGDLEGGAVTVSNVGMYGASRLVPIIDPGQSSILGVGAARPVFRPDAAGAPALRQELGLALSCDHRVHDGVKAARFLNLVTHFLEHPALLMRS